MRGFNVISGTLRELQIYLMAPNVLLYTSDFGPFSLESWMYILGALISGVKTLIND